VVTGGFVTTLFSIRLSARSPLPAFLIAAAATGLWLLATARRGHLALELERLDARWAARWKSVVLATALTAATVSGVFHTFSATGSDASGYLSYSRLLLEGRLTRVEPLAPIARWTDGPATLAPLGWRAGRDARTQVPTYAVGLPLLIAPFLAVGDDTAASLAIPPSFALAIVAAAVLAFRLAGAYPAVLTAAWLATSPVRS
jgi:hypothetical protein